MFIIWVLALFLIVSSCHKQNDINYRKVTIESETTLSIGDRTSSTSDYLFGRIQGVAVDTAGRIYVGDQSAARVKVYNASGQFLRSIGRRGDGPGEFRKIRDVHITPESRLVVVDGTTRRITRMTLKGKVLNVEHFKNSIEPYNGLYYWNNRNYIVPDLSVNRYLSNKKQVFHIFNNTLSKHLESFGKLSNIGFSNEWDPVLHSTNIGSILFVRRNSFLFSPWMYEGSIYKFAYNKNMWIKSDTLHGVVGKTPPYTRLEPTPDQQSLQYNIWTSTPIRGEGREELAFVTHNQSRGLYQFNNGHIIHFTLLRRNHKRVFGAAIYNSKGDLLGYGPIEGDLPSPRPRSENSDAWYLPLTIHTKGEDDTFYIEDTSSGIPTVRVVDIEYDITGSN